MEDAKTFFEDGESKLAIELIIDLVSGIKHIRGELFLRNELISLIAPDIEWKEQHLTDRTDERIRQIVEVYRKIFPKPPTQEG